MYAAFDLKMNQNDVFLKKIMCFLQDGQESVDNRIKDTKEVLSSYVNNGVINGSALSDDWFPNIDSDVFISYSHDDENIAIALTGYLEKTFGLKVFLDSIYWNSADELLHKIDEAYCVNKNTEHGRYNYTKRNYSTSHVHAMLSMAILKTIDKSETVFFINTNNSIPKAHSSIEGHSTQSPWLFEEIMFASLIRREYRFFRKDAAFSESESNRPFNMEYEVPLNNLTELSCSDLEKWEKLYRERGNQIGGALPLGVVYPLISLYDLKLRK